MFKLIELLGFLVALVAISYGLDKVVRSFYRGFTTKDDKNKDTK